MRASRFRCHDCACKTQAMKPSFALDFRDGAIALLHRTSRGWQQVGATSIEAPDLGEALNYLRSTALGLSPRGLATKLVIPNEQVLYTTVHAPGPEAAKRRKQIKAALEGLTPYKVDELVFDWWGSGPEVHVAVVAKETLAEAEGFAAEHRFNPVSFVAVPDNGAYLGEPFFGASALSATLLSEGEKVERDQDPILVVARDYPRAEPVAAAQAQPVAVAQEVVAAEPASIEPEPVVEEVPAAKAVTLAEEAPALAEPEVEVVPIPAEPVTPVAATPVAAEPAAATVDEPSPALPEANPLPDFSAARLPASGVPSFDPKAMAVELADEAPMALDVAETTDAAAEAPARPKSAEPAPAAPPAAESAAPVAADDLPPTPAPSILSAFSSRRTAEKAEAAPPARPASTTDFATAAAEAKARKAPSVGPAPGQRPSVPRPNLAKPAASLPSASRDALPFPGRAAAAKLLPGKGKPNAGVVPPKGERNVVPLPKASAQAGEASAATPAKSAKGLGSFGDRSAPVRGKPRYLGLILTGILLLALAILAAWSSYFLSANDVTPSGGANETAVADTATAAAEPLPSAADEALADGQDPDLAAADPATAPADAATTATADAAVAPAAETAAAEPAPETAVATDAAATAKPGNDPQDEIFLAAADNPPTTRDAILLPSPVATSDPPPELAAPPPPFGTVYTFDANGRIQPTPEGIITPEGVLLVEGAPQRVPPSRPAALTQPSATAAAPADGQAAAVAATNTDATASETFQADPALAGKKPRSRPEGLVPADPAADQQGDLATPVADSRYAGFRPQRRPDALTEPSAPAQDLAANEAAAASLAAGGLQSEATALGVAVSRKPMARPSGMDQAVDAAVAAALQTADPQPEAQAETASAAPEEQAEPEVEAPAPDLPTNASVAKQATTKNALNLSKVALIGIFGTSSSRYAMIRQAGGGIKRVKVGDTIDGGRVASITATELVYQKGGRMVTLTLPRG